MNHRLLKEEDKSQGPAKVGEVVAIFGKEVCRIRCWTITLFLHSRRGANSGSYHITALGIGSSRLTGKWKFMKPMFLHALQH